jgi:hypothetical protein
MRINRQQIYVQGQSELIGDRKIFLSGRDIELQIVFQLQQHGQFGRRMRREIEPDAGLDHLWLSRGLQVGVEDQIRTRVEAQRH